MKLHRVLAEGSVSILEEALGAGRVLDRVVEQRFRKEVKWGKRDRALVAETVFEVVRWRRAFGWLAGSDDLRALCVAAWQRMGLEIPGWWSWEGEGVEEMRNRESGLVEQPRAVRESVPDWLDERGERELGEAWDGVLAALNRPAPVDLRVNRLKVDREGVKCWLAEAGLEADEVEGAEDALRLRGRKLLPKPMLEEGKVEIQDAGSQQIAPMLEAGPGMRVVDACAGAGGKTLHLAALMEGRGELMALDVAAAKLEELRRRARRAGAEGIRTEVWTPSKPGEWRGVMDRLLMDVPCSGLGTLRRQPDLKWRLKEEEIEKVRRLQRRLLDEYAEMVKPGGKLVYATCSVLVSENRRQVEDFLERDGRWEWEEEKSLLPHRSGTDGLYGARLRRVR